MVHIESKQSFLSPTSTGSHVLERRKKPSDCRWARIISSKTKQVLWSFHFRRTANRKIRELRKPQLERTTYHHAAKRRGIWGDRKENDTRRIETRTASCRRRTKSRWAFLFPHKKRQSMAFFWVKKKTPMDSPTRLQAREFRRAHRVPSEPTNPAPKMSLLLSQLG